MITIQPQHFLTARVENPTVFAGFGRINSQWKRTKSNVTTRPGNHAVADL